MHWLWQQTPSLLLTTYGAIVFLLAGNKKRYSWMLGFLSEFAWLWYAIWLHQYGLIVGCVFYAVVYMRNYVRWGREQITN